MVPRLSAREQKTLAIVGLLGVGILWMYLAFIVGPLAGEAGSLARQIRETRDDLQMLEVTTANEAALREQERQLQESVTSLRELLPDEEELPQVIELLSDLASQSQVKIQTIFPQRGERGAADGSEEGEDLGPSVYKDVVIQIEAVTGFHQLGTFLNLIESGDKPMQVSYLRIAKDPKQATRIKVKLLIQAFFAAKGAVTVPAEAS